MTTGTNHVQTWHRMVRMIATDPALKDEATLLARLAEEKVTGPLEILARFTDARPADGSIVSGDGPFTFIARTVADQVGTTTVDWLHLRFFDRVLRLWHDDQDLAKSVRQATYRPGYWAEVAEIDRWLDDRKAGGDLDERPALATERDPGGTISGDRWRLLLAGSPRISQVPAEYLRADIRALPQHPSTLADYGEDPDSYHQASKTLLDSVRAGSGDFDAQAQVRLDVALHLVRRRRFAKVRMLELGWPDLMERVRMPGGIRRLRQLEARVLGDTDIPTPSDAWLQYESDERLSEFLRIRPHFRMIFDDQLSRMVGSTEGQAAADSRPNTAARDEWDPYSDAKLYLEPPDGADMSTLDLLPRQMTYWHGIARLCTASGEQTWPVTIDVAAFRGAAAGLGSLYLVAPSALVRPGTSTRDIAAPDASAMVERVGDDLWSQTIGRDATASAAFLAVLTDHKRVRLTVSSAVAGLTDLPWECLRVPALRITAGLTLKLSIVRQVRDAINIAHRSVGAPLRVLAVHSEPTGMSPLPGARQELQLLRESFAEAEQQGWASLVTVADATERDLRERLRRFRPHVLHFTGHGGIDHAAGTAALVLNGDDGNPFLLTADQLAVQLWDSGVVLAVLSGCDTGVNPGSDRVTFGVCQSIIRQGVPAVVATARPVMDNAALRFAQEFYQAFMDGYPLEACVTEARKGLFMQGWDWSAWTVFAADPAALELIRLRRRGGMTP